MKNKIKNAKGITLLALVITIVILIILATISINWIFGENGLVNRTEQAKFEHSKAEARERLELVLADAYVEKNVNKAEYNQNEFLDDFIHEQEPEANMFLHGEGEVISLNGHAFWLDRSVPKIGEYAGPEENLPPVITRINILDKTTSSANIEVITTKSDGLKYKYAIKELGQGDESYTQETEKSDNTNEFIGLQENTIYTVKVELIKDGEIVNTKIINVVIGIIEKGVVRFEEIVWKNGQASVKILTDETDYTLQYQIGGIDDNSWINTTSGSIISGLEYGQTVYGRLWSQYGESDPASCDVVDKIAPIVTVTPNGTNTNSISVQVQAIDNESGMADSVTYKYFVKESSQPDTNYIQKGTDTTGNYTITGLTQGTSYDVKVEVTGDKAGNTGIGYLYNQTTGTLPEVGQEGLTLRFGTPTWSSGTANLPVTTTTSYEIEYQIGGITEGSWKTIANGGTIRNIANNSNVYARLSDGTNKTDYIYAKVFDNELPIANIILESTKISKNGKVKADITITDNNSGVDTTKCKWILNKISSQIGTNSNLYTGGIISSEKQKIETNSIPNAGDYYLHVLAVDNAGNSKEYISEKVIVENSYLISTPQDLQNIKNDLTGKYYVVNDIDMADFSFTTIDGEFKGTIDGQGHKISNFTMSDSSSTSIFEQIGSGVTIKNIIFDKVNLRGAGYRTSLFADRIYDSSNILFEKVGVTGEIRTNSAKVSTFFYSSGSDITFKDCYSRVNIYSGSKYDAAGFYVEYVHSDFLVKMENCYWSGTNNTTGRSSSLVCLSVVANNDNQMSSNNIIIKNCYYDKQKYPLKINSTISGVGLTTEQMKNMDSYVGFDFENTWYKNAEGYPELRF